MKAAVICLHLWIPNLIMYWYFSLNCAWTCWFSRKTKILGRAIALLCLILQEVLKYPPRKVERVDSFIVSCERICIFPFLFGLRIIMKIDLPPFFLYHSCYKQLCLIIFHSLLLHPSPHYILLLIHFSDNQEEPVTIQSTHSCWNSMSYKKGVCYFILIVNLITTRNW